MTTNPAFENLVNSIRNMFQQSSINYAEIYNTLNTHLDVFNENASNLLDNVLPVFTLPEFTLPHMAIVYAISNHFQAQPPAAAANYLNPAYQDKLLLSIESCVQQADCKQVLNSK